MEPPSSTPVSWTQGCAAATSASWPAPIWHTLHTSFASPRRADVRQTADTVREATRPFTRLSCSLACLIERALLSGKAGEDRPAGPGACMDSKRSSAARLAVSAACLACESALRV